jgi:hypothetical protein
MSACPGVRRLPRGGACAAVAALLWLAGCGVDTVRLPTAPAVLAPGDATPTEAVRLLEWSWNHKSVAAYRNLFTQDYRFAFSTLEPYGAYAGDAWTREDEMAFATHLFVGGHPIEPPAIRISLRFDHYLLVRDDPRPGKNPDWHKLIWTSLSLVVVDSSRETLITGFGNFYLVRGDSAAVPAEIIPLGYAADSTHWYIDRWEDDTASSGGGRAMPTKNTTLGALKALYR